MGCRAATGAPYFCLKLPKSEKRFVFVEWKGTKTVDLISSLIANTHGKQFFNEYDVFTNDTQQEVFNLHQRQKIVFTVSGLSGKLIRWFVCLFSNI